MGKCVVKGEDGVQQKASDNVVTISKFRSYVREVVWEVRCRQDEQEQELCVNVAGELQIHIYACIYTRPWTRDVYGEENR